MKTSITGDSGKEKDHAGPKALREMCEAEIAKHQPCDGCDNATIARALLDRLSGEAVTREKLLLFLQGFSYDSLSGKRIIPSEAIVPLGDALMALLPAGMDRNAVIEDCAQHLDKVSASLRGELDWDQAFEGAAASIRALKSS